MFKQDRTLVIGISLILIIVATAFATAITNQQAGANDYTELKTTTLQAGQGERQAKAADKIKVHYVGKLKDGTQFESSYEAGQPIELTLGEGSVIAGWEQGLLGMKQGEKRQLEIPSSLGYGATGSGTSIPANAGLLFEVELVEFTN